MHVYFWNRLDARDGIAIEVLRDDLATVAQCDLSPSSCTQTIDDPAFNLGANEIGIYRDAAVEDERDALQVDPLSFILRYFDHYRAVTQEATASNASRATFGDRRVPRTQLSGNFERMQRARRPGEEITTKIDWVAASGNCQFIER